METLVSWLGIAGAVVGLGSGVAAAIFSRGQTAANDFMRGLIDVQRGRIADLEHQVKTQESQCREDMAEVREEMRMLRSTFVRELAKEVATEVAVQIRRDVA